MELATKLKVEKCKLNDDDYALLQQFFEKITLFIDCKEMIPLGFENNLKIMRKLIWKIKEGITKYS